MPKEKMKVTILFIILSVNIYANNYKELINKFNQNAKPHFKKSGCLNDTLKYLKNKKYFPYIYIENTPSGYELYCNSFWIVKDKGNEKVYIIRALVEDFYNFKDYQRNIEANLVLKNNYKSKKLSKIKWWIYQKEIKKKDFIIIKNYLKSLKKIENCYDNVKYHGKYNRIGKKMFLQGRIIIGYPELNKLDYKRDYSGALDDNCKSIKELGEFIIYLFDGNKNINQGTLFSNEEHFIKNSLIYKKVDRENKKLNKLLIVNLKTLLIDTIKLYKKNKNKKLSEIFKVNKIEGDK